MANENRNVVKRDENTEYTDNNDELVEREKDNYSTDLLDWMS